MPVSKSGVPLRVAGHVVNAIAVLCLVGVTLFFAVPKVMHWDIVVVLSGSMEPALPVGSVIFVQPARPEQVAVGDIITYVVGDSGTFVTHRVIEVKGQGATLTFRTKGDANEDPDQGTVPASALRGKVWVDIPYVGYVAQQARSREGFLLLLGIPGALIVAGEARSIVREIKAMRARKKSSLEVKS